MAPSVQLVTKTVGRARAGTAMAAPFSAPRTSFNGTITGHRAIALADMDLEDIREIKTATGTTVNDVVLAVAGGALRSYLDDRGELPVELAAGDRAGLGPRRVASASKGANKVSALFAKLGTDTEDPLERLRGHGASQPERQGAPQRDQRRLAAGLGRVRRAAHLRPRRARVRRPPAGREAPGRAQPGDLQRPRPAGAALLHGRPRSSALYPLGPVFHGAGLNITVMSNNGRVHVGIIACRESMPDVDDLVRRFPVELAEPRRRPSAAQQEPTPIRKKADDACQKAGRELQAERPPRSP